MTGENTFSCRVNGQIWLPFKKPQFLDGGEPPLSAFLEMPPNTPFQNLIIGATRIRSDNISKEFESSSSISIRIDSIYTPGIYPVNFFNADSTMRLWDTRRTIISTNGMKSKDGYHGQGSGQVHITTLDTANKIVSGTFNFTVPRTDGSNLNITEGRFDLKLGK
jgi:hypothetical protein